jgi:GT2 family glycosyltransferase
MGEQPRVTVVIATRDRRRELLDTLDRLRALPERPPIVVVDNGSRDGSAEAARACAGVDVLALRDNLGCGARTLGAARAATPYLAFSDDDSWWGAGSLRRAATLLDRHPRLALIAARVLVGPGGRLDPVSERMRSSPLQVDPDLPGRRTLGFVACGAVVRRSAFLAAGGFNHRFGIGGEEELLALDLTATGWGVAYADDVVAHHYPSPSRDPVGRRRVQARNDLWTTWLRRPARTVARDTLRSLRAALSDRSARAGLVDAVRGLPWVLGERRPVPPALEADLRLLEAVT